MNIYCKAAIFALLASPLCIKAMQGQYDVGDPSFLKLVNEIDAESSAEPTNTTRTFNFGFNLPTFRYLLTPRTCKFLSVAALIGGTGSTRSLGNGSSVKTYAKIFSPEDF